MPRVPPKPHATAIVLCEGATMDEQTGRWTLTGVVVVTDTAPHDYCLYVAVRGAVGAYELSLDVVDEATGARSPLEMPSRRVEVPTTAGLFDSVARGLSLQFPAAGSYLIVLRMNGDDVGYARLRVHDEPGLTSKTRSL
jgi:hypothetical protein